MGDDLVGRSSCALGETVEGDLLVPMPFGPPLQAKFNVKVPCGGLHIAVPVSELNSLFGTRLTA